MNARPAISAEQHFLAEALEPIRVFLDDPAVVEISCQRSNEIWLEKIGQLRMVRQEIDGLDQEAIRHMASRAASFTKQTINADLPANFQSSEFNLEHGFIDRVVDRQAGGRDQDKRG